MPEPLRSDARRNREKILAAASELFALEGPDLCVDAIARRAGVGHATVFRRFPTKDDLVIAMFEDRLTEFAEIAEAAADGEDPWKALVEVMAAIADRQARDRGLMEAVGSQVFGSPRLREHRTRLVDAVDRLVARARGAGVLRDDLTALDVLLLVSAVGKSAGCGFDTDLWRRYLGVIVDGMRPDAATPLEPPAPTLAELEDALSASREPAPRSRGASRGTG